MDVRHAKPGSGCFMVGKLVERGVFSFGTDGTRGIGKGGLVLAIRVYRMIPTALRHRLHPQPGSSAAGLKAARAGRGTHGVAQAIACCGCA